MVAQKLRIILSTDNIFFQCFLFSFLRQAITPGAGCADNYGFRGRYLHPDWLVWETPGLSGRVFLKEFAGFAFAAAEQSPWRVVKSFARSVEDAIMADRFDNSLKPQATSIILPATCLPVPVKSK